MHVQVILESLVRLESPLTPCALEAGCQVPLDMVAHGGFALELPVAVRTLHGQGTRPRRGGSFRVVGLQVVQEVLHVVEGLWTFAALVLPLLVTLVGVALVLQVLGQV